MRARAVKQGSPKRIQDPSLAGLSESEVLERRAHGQGNVIRLKASRSYLQIARENVFTSINTIMFLLGFALLIQRQISDALVSVGVVFFNVFIGVAQEIRAKRTLERIALLTRPEATVIREGQEQPVDPGEIVVDDLLVVRPGDQIVVDGQVTGDGHMDVDESLLTGESDLVSKHAGDRVYSGSFCVTGSACYRAEQVGAKTLASQLTTEARAFRRISTPLQQQIKVIVQVMLFVAIFFEILLVIGWLIKPIPLVEGVEMAVVIIGIVPRGLILATSVAYALGAVRIIDKGALAQQINAIESLSNVDILCLDKTGTLTANALTLDALYPLGITASELREALGDYVRSISVGNATTTAIGKACGGQARHVREEVLFSSARKWSALSIDDATLQGVHVLGAPDILQPFLSPGAKLGTSSEAEVMQGRRVLLFAFSPTLVPLHDATGEPRLPSDLVPLGIVSLGDQLRPEAQEVLTAFAKVGIQLKIISGDHPQTVAALARQVGLGTGIGVVSGEALAEMDTAQLAQVAEESTIFGRVTPQQKAQLVQALRSRGHYVAMIGDGVNDVPSLKQANLGVAMQSGSQASRGVADMVLLHDSFAALPQVFSEGQRICNGMHNILKLFLTRILYATVLLVGTLVIGGFPFEPKQNSILTLLTEGVPVLALATWARPGPSTGRPPRSFFHFVIPAGVTLGMAGLGVYVAELIYTSQLPVAQSALTTFAVCCGLLLIPFVIPPTRVWVGGSVLNGDWRPSLLALGLLVAYGLILCIPPLRTFFDFVALGVKDYAFIGVAAIAWGLILRWIWRARLLERFLQVDWK